MRLLIFQLVIIILFILAVLENYYPKLKNIFMVIGVFCLSSLFLTLDKYVPDFYMYQKFYDDLISAFEMGIEKGYIYFTFFLKNIGFNFFQFRLIIGVLNVVLLYVGFKKIMDKPNLCMLCYMSSYFLEKPYIQIRNALAIAIFLNIIPYFIKKKYYKGILGIILSCFFHATSIVYFIVIFFNVKILETLKKKKIKVICLISCILSYLLYRIDIIRFFSLINENIPLGRLNAKIYAYILYEGSKMNSITENFGIGGIYFFLLYFIFSFYLIKRKNINQNEKYIFLFYSVTITLKLLSYKIEILDRIIDNYHFAQTCALAYLNQLFKNKYKIFYYILILALVLGYNFLFGIKLSLW